MTSPGASGPSPGPWHRVPAYGDSTDVRVRGDVLPGIVVAAVAAIGICIDWRVFVDTWAGQRVEYATLKGARYGQNKLWHVAEPVLNVVSVSFIAAVLLAAVLIAVLRRRWMLAVQVAVLMTGANLTTRILKLVIVDRPDLGVAGPRMNTLPSGHTTAAASIAAVLVLVVPPRARPWAAVLGAVYTAATGVSTLVGQWHRPSDVVAAVLVVTAWGGLTSAIVARHPGGSGRASRSARGHGAPATAELALGSTVHAMSSRVRLAALFLVVVGLGAAVPASLALRRSWHAVGQLDTRAELLTAYAGGAFGVLAASFLGFAVLLVVRHLATARVGSA